MMSRTHRIVGRFLPDGAMIRRVIMMLLRDGVRIRRIVGISVLDGVMIHHVVGKFLPGRVRIRPAPECFILGGVMMCHVTKMYLLGGVMIYLFDGTHLLIDGMTVPAMRGMLWHKTEWIACVPIATTRSATDRVDPVLRVPCVSVGISEITPFPD